MTKKYWSMTEGVFNCLIDRKRTIAFKKAINNTVKQGDIVADMGTGSGILAMLAADAGAKQVYAIELDEKNIRTLDQTFAANGYSDRIHVVKGDATKVTLPEMVDVIIGEMIATGLIEELQIPAVNNLLKFAKPDTRVMLNTLENYADLVFNRENYYGYSMKIIRYEYPGEPALKSVPFTKKYLYRKVDFAKPVGDTKIDELLSFEIEREGVINAVRISSRTKFYDGSTFDESSAYCYPIILPVNEFSVRSGDIITLNLRYKMCEGFGTLKYSIGKD